MWSQEKGVATREGCGHEGARRDNHSFLIPAHAHSPLAVLSVEWGSLHSLHTSFSDASPAAEKVAELLAQAVLMLSQQTVPEESLGFDTVDGGSLLG